MVDALADLLPADVAREGLGAEADEALGAIVIESGAATGLQGGCKA